MIRLFARVCVSALVVTMFAAAAAPRSFTHAGLTFDVEAANAEDADLATYDVVVRDDLRTYTRLAVKREGDLRDAWLADLDRDGRVEVIVATADAASARVDIHEWHEFRFETTRPPPDGLPGFRGNVEFSVDQGRLLLTRPTPADAIGDPDAGGEPAVFEYVPAQNRWMPRTR